MVTIKNLAGFWNPVTPSFLWAADWEREEKESCPVCASHLARKQWLTGSRLKFLKIFFYLLLYWLSSSSVGDDRRLIQRKMQHPECCAEASASDQEGDPCGCVQQKRGWLKQLRDGTVPPTGKPLIKTVWFFFWSFLPHQAYLYYKLNIKYFSYL